MSNNNQNITNNDKNELGDQNMDDDQSPHGGNGSSPCDHLKPNKAIQPSCIIFSLIIWHFEIKSEVVQLLSKLHGINKESPFYIFINSKKCALLSAYYQPAKY